MVLWVDVLQRCEGKTVTGVEVWWWYESTKDCTMLPPIMSVDGVLYCLSFGTPLSCMGELEDTRPWSAGFGGLFFCC